MSGYVEDRISWSEKNGERVIAIHGQIERWLEGLLLGWNVLWFGVGMLILWQLLGDFGYSEQERNWFIAFLAFWAFFLYKGLRAWAWRKWGKELIKVTPDAITYKRDIRSYGNARRFLRSNVKQISKAEYSRFSFTGSYLTSFWVVSGGVVHFDYLNKRITLGIQLEEKDATKLVGLLSKPIRTKA